MERERERVRVGGCGEREWVHVSGRNGDRWRGFWASSLVSKTEAVKIEKERKEVSSTTRIDWGVNGTIHHLFEHIE